MNRIYASERILYNEPMARHTTFRTGGPADCMVFPISVEDVVQTMRLCKEEGTPLMIIGNGSNLLVSDKGIRGVVMVFSEHFSAVTVEDNILTVQAGATLGKAANTALEHGLSGLEFASGIPGTLGGGCAMNAGAYGGQLSDVLMDALVLMNGELITLSNAEMQMGYRSTRPLREGGIVLSARFALSPADKKETCRKKCATSTVAAATSSL
jgi:UDP-N-acetylmuramate dehydrogenase